MYLEVFWLREYVDSLVVLDGRDPPLLLHHLLGLHHHHRAILNNLEKTWITLRAKIKS